MKKPIQNPIDHNCKYCPIKEQKLAASPHLKFCPPSLRQNALLKIAYATYAKTSDESIENFPLPSHLIEEIKMIHEEIDRWDQDTATLYKMVGRRFNFRHRDIENDYESTLEWTDHRCFLPDLHWLPGKNVIDRRETTKMILQCDVGFDRRHEFLLAVASCLETDVDRLWQLLDGETRERWPSTYYCGFTQDPIFMYWMGKLTNHPARMNRALQDMTHRCLRPGDHNFALLNYFWPMIVENMGGIDSEKMKRLFDHAFHESIQFDNRPATFFIWNLAPPRYYRSMVSAERCCGARSYYFSFQKAVASGHYDAVQLMWDSMDVEQHNRILLAEHAKAFCKAAEKGFTDIARMLWHEATYNQKFILLFEQSCLAFRLACANGHMGVIRMLWEVASVDQRRQMLTVCDCEALTSPCKNGHLNVVQYLWENMGDELKALMDTLMENSMMLSKCICETALLVSAADYSSKPGGDGGAVLRYIFSLSNSTMSLPNPTPFHSQLVHALLFNDAAALKAVFKRGEITGNWVEISDLLSGIESDGRAHLMAKMSVEQAILCGFSTVTDNVLTPSVFGDSVYVDCVPKKQRCE